MQKTANYALNKPDGTDVVNIQNFNDNADIIDIQLKKNANNTDILDKKVSTHLADKTAHGIGDRTQLKTTAKDTLVNAVNELFTSGTNGKNDIYNAISAKGTTPASKNFADLVSAISNINTGKKFATGNISFGWISNDDPITKRLKTISGLTFKPSIIYLNIYDDSYASGLSFYWLYDTVNNKQSTLLSGGADNAYIDAISSSGFTIQVRTSSSQSWNCNIGWLAIE